MFYRDEFTLIEAMKAEHSMRSFGKKESLAYSETASSTSKDANSTTCGSECFDCCDFFVVSASSFSFTYSFKYFLFLFDRAWREMRQALSLCFYGVGGCLC